MTVQPFPQPSVVPVPQSRIELVARRVGAWALTSWAWIITAFFGIICLAAISAPVLTYVGLDEIAKPIFFALHFICGQIPSHSFYIEGHQTGLCVHCLAIYGSLCVSSLFFALSKKRMRGIPWWLMVLLALPLAYDGFSQMFGLRQSTWEIRLVTGVLFGLGAAWFALPLLHKGLQEVTPSA